MSYQDKALCITARYSGTSFEHDLKKHSRTHVAVPIMYQIPRGKNNGNIHTEKAPTLTSNSWEHNNKVIEPLGCALRTWPRVKTGGGGQSETSGN